jgi:hypothetical protein
MRLGGVLFLRTSTEGIAGACEWLVGSAEPQLSFVEQRLLFHETTRIGSRHSGIHSSTSNSYTFNHPSRYLAAVLSNLRLLQLRRLSPSASSAINRTQRNNIKQRATLFPHINVYCFHHASSPFRDAGAPRVPKPRRAPFVILSHT